MHRYAPQIWGRSHFDKTTNANPTKNRIPKETKGTFFEDAPNPMPWSYH